MNRRNFLKTSFASFPVIFFTSNLKISDYKNLTIVEKVIFQFEKLFSDLKIKVLTLSEIEKEFCFNPIEIYSVYLKENFDSKILTEYNFDYVKDIEKIRENYIITTSKVISYETYLKIYFKKFPEKNCFASLHYNLIDFNRGEIISDFYKFKGKLILINYQNENNFPDNFLSEYFDHLNVTVINIETFC